MIKNADVYDSPVWFVLQQINIHWYGKISQQSMSYHSDLVKISIHNYKQETLSAFMLGDDVYSTRTLN